MTRYTFFGFLALALIIISPTAADAYTSHDQKVVQITENAALFTISYRFGIPQRDFYLPIGAVRDIAANNKDFVVGYEFLEDRTDYTDKGASAGIVLSNAKVVDGKYYVPAGTFKTFTLVVLLTTEQTDAEMDYALHVNALPFTSNVDGKLLKQKLNATELKHYLTPEIELNESN